MAKLYVAAGGGGDALAAAIVHRALGHTEPAVIATYAWDRLWIDPVPGPRRPADFRGLRPLGAHNFIVTPDTEPLPPSGSTLPRLAADLDDSLVLLDPSGGAAGMRAQLRELVDLVRPDGVHVLDVGGDVVARGDEPGLRSPLADALVLASALEVGVGADVVVAGPGLDGELPAEQVLTVVGEQPIGRITVEAVEIFRHIIDWHPSEATALLVASALGHEGRVEIRDSGLQVLLTCTSASIYRVSLADVLNINRVARAIRATSSLDEVERATRRVCGFSELDHERKKAASAVSGLAQSVPADEVDRRIHALAVEAAARNVDFVTTRRIAELAGLSERDLDVHRRHAAGPRQDRPAWPLWSTRAETSADVPIPKP